MDIPERLIGTDFDKIPAIGDRVFVGRQTVSGSRDHPAEAVVVAAFGDVSNERFSFGPALKIRTADGDEIEVFISEVFATPEGAARTFRDPPRLETVVRFDV